MRKIILFTYILLLIPLCSEAQYLLKILRPFMFNNFAFGTNYCNFNNTNQFVLSYFDKFITNKEFQYYKFWENISFGLRTRLYKKPELIYKFTLLEGNGVDPILDKDRPLMSGNDNSFWNYFTGSTLINIDKTQIENILIQWAQVRFGIGISTYGLNNKPEIFNIDAFITGKLGYNTINLGENYFQGINDFNKYLSGLEPGLRIDLNIYYKNIYYFRPYMDFTSFKSDFIKKLSIGVKNDYIFYIDMTSKNSTPIHLKIYLDVNYNKYNFKNDKLDFYKIDLGLLMFSTIYKY